MDFNPCFTSSHIASNASAIFWVLNIFFFYFICDFFLFYGTEVMTNHSMLMSTNNISKLIRNLYLVN